MCDGPNQQQARRILRIPGTFGWRIMLCPVNESFGVSCASRRCPSSSTSKNSRQPECPRIAHINGAAMNPTTAVQSSVLTHYRFPSHTREVQPSARTLPSSAHRYCFYREETNGPLSLSQPEPIPHKLHGLNHLRSRCLGARRARGIGTRPRQISFEPSWHPPCRDVRNCTYGAVLV
jgi:hypothetical protein